MLTGKIVSEQVASFFLEVPDQQKPLLSSFSVDALRAVRETVPELSIGYLVNQIPEQWDQELDVLGAVALHANHEHLSRQQVVMIKESGRWVFCYTVNTRERAHELFDWGVDGLCTDRIDLIW